ncbi:MAG: bifunctional metallophosphatase/5'-nucleotidase, partial [Acidimicrobiia bacterium]|nr:bifunctional metallophosphatase/5'-nucleotidase [Acidimicrobiia bacterium]
TGRVTVDADVVAHTQTEIDRLRGQGVDIVIVASHLASLGADRALVESLSGVDLTLGGGGEDVLASPNDIVAPGDEALVAGSYPLLVTDRDGRAVPLAATSGRYRYLGRLVAWFDGAGEIVRLAPESGPLAVTAELAPQRFVQRRVVDEVRGRVAAQPVEPLAISQVELDGVRVLMRTAESNFGDLVADAVLEAGRTGADEVDAAPPTVALVGSGGLGNDRVVPPGPFTVRDSFDMAGPELVMVSPPLSPDRLRRVLEYAVARGEDVAPRWVQVAGLSIEVDLTKRPLELDADGRVIQGGRRIRSVTLADGDRIVVDGQVVGDTDVVVAFDQSLVRGGHPLGDLSDAVVVGATVQQALAEHLTTRLEGAIGSRQYPEGGQGRIVRPGIPPRP